EKMIMDFRRVASATFICFILAVSSGCPRNDSAPADGSQTGSANGTRQSSPSLSPEQQEAIEAIKALGGTVSQGRSGLIIRLPAASQADNETLSKLVVFANNIERLYLEGPDFGDEGLANVAKLSSLRVLGLQDTAI